MPRAWRHAVGVALLSLTGAAHAAPAVSTFSPQGETRDVRQVGARFSEPLVAFGDPRVEAPFEVTCPAAGRGRWIDTRQWVYEFERPLPAGLQCSFRVRADLRTPGGAAVTAATFEFTTGGPAVRGTLPAEDDPIDARQAFLLVLDAPADAKSIAERAFCAVQGIGERVPVRLADEAERAKLMTEQREGLLRLTADETSDDVRSALTAEQAARVVALRCARALPPEAEVRLVWAAGIRSVSGIAARQDQTLTFSVRPDFTARIDCERTSKDAGCVPLLPVTIRFSAPVPRKTLAAIALASTDGRKFAGTIAGRDGPADAIVFKGPFPEKSVLKLALPATLADDGERALANRSALERPIVIDEDPPLVKFGASFGILEAAGGAALPVTVRNVEPVLRGVVVDAKLVQPRTGGTLARVDSGSDAALLAWLSRVLRGPPMRASRPGEPPASIGEVPLLGLNATANTLEARSIELPRSVEKAFEVIGIPLQKPGFYIVELASPRLGRVLNESAKPYHVYSSALVTDMAIHFKRGAESSIAWVTRLQDAKPVAGAKVAVNDCNGRVLWSGTTGTDGIARVDAALADGASSNDCVIGTRNYFVTARAGDDVSFMLTSWDDGIERYAFGLPSAQAYGPIAAHSVLDRALFRAGETVSMKHFVRRRVAAGLRDLDRSARPSVARIVHVGSGQEYSIPLAWREHAAASAWPIPKDAKLGTYEIYLKLSEASRGEEIASGTFRVEQFRVPLMRAQLKAPSANVINATSVGIDAQLAYLAGGPAANVPVRVRSSLAPRTPEFAGYEAFRFVGREPKEGIEAIGEDDEGLGEERGDTPVRTQNLTLDGSGGARITIDQLPKRATPQTLQVEMEYADPNGQLLTASTRVPILPAAIAVGLRADGYSHSRDRLAFRVVALDPRGTPVAGRSITVDAYERRVHAVRKRLLGGFYAYEQTAEVKRAGLACKGATDAQGLLICAGRAPASGNLILVARAADDAGNKAIAAASVFVAGGDDWVGAGASDRIDLVPDKRAYRPGETAKVEVRMPFREAIALVTIEREGVLESRVQPISAKQPMVEVPIAERFAPNAYVSVLVVRGRVDPEVPGPFAWLKRMVYRVGYWVGLVKEVPREIDTRPTALVDLAKPAFRVGVAAIRVGWDAHELKVTVAPERETYKVRDKAIVKVSVTDARGKPAANAEVALAAVDEGLLALKANESWDLLPAMMQTRALDVATSTAQSQVIGRRHFGRKATAPGGGGGAGAGARELFDTLLTWQPHVRLDEKGEARIEVPLNDSLTAFRVVAIAHAGEAQFGTGGGTIRATQDLMLFAGLPPVVREGDRFNAMLTVRNAADRELAVDVGASLNGKPITPPPDRVTLKAGEARTLSFPIDVPFDAPRLDWQFQAKAGTSADTLKTAQRVVAAQPVRVLQQTIAQLDAGAPRSDPIALPQGAVPGRGGVEVRLARSVAGDLSALKEWMQAYPYTCLEQRVSRAVALEDDALWEATMSSLPAFLDRDGLARFFATDRLEGDDVLTAYLLSIAEASGRPIPEAARKRMLDGLAAFVEGRVRRGSSLPTADLALRRIAAIDALARYGAANAKMLESIEIAPGLWPTSAILDWIGILQRMESVPRRAERLAEAKSQLRQRLDLSGTTLAFSTERGDYLWWLLVSPDLNAARALAILGREADFRDDMPRLARGALARQQGGRWSTTNANAWGVVALRRFAQAFEATPPSGTTQVAIGSETRSLDWAKTARDTPGPQALIAWPANQANLRVTHEGAGKPWVFIQSKAAVPLAAPISAGFTVKRTVAPIARKTNDGWSRGDTYRVTLDIEANSDRTWVVVNDPIPSGAAILGGGLGGESQQQRAAGSDGRAWLAFEERTFEGYRAYYRFVPKGAFSVSYTVRLDNPGKFLLPAARVEAMYSPEVFAEMPVASIEVRQ